MRRFKDSLLDLTAALFKEYYLYYIFALVSLFVTHKLQVLLPFWAKALGDKIKASQLEEISIMSFLGLAIGIMVFRSLSRILFFYPARVIQRDLKVELIENLERARPDTYKDFPSGDLFQIIQNDLDQIRAYLGFALLQIGNIVVAFTLLVPQIIMFNQKILWAFIPLVLSSVIFVIIVYKSRVLFKASQDSKAVVQQNLIEDYKGKQTIANFDKHYSFIQRFKSISFEELSVNYKAGIGPAVSVPLINLGVGISLVLGSYILVSNGAEKSELIVLSGLIFLFREPLMFLSWIGVVMAMAFGSWDRIQKLLRSIRKESEMQLEFSKENHIQESKADRWELSCVIGGTSQNLTVHRRRWNIILGETGIGKSYTLEKLANIFRDQGISVSYVGQDAILFSDSLKNNIFFMGELKASQERLARNLLKIFMLENLAGEKDIFNLEVGENGKMLSGGQVKRLAMIRSLIDDTEVIIWDDPFAAIDLIMEEAIIKYIKESDYFANKTFVLSGHRYSTFKHMDYYWLLGKDRLITKESFCKSAEEKDREVHDFFKKQMD